MNAVNPDWNEQAAKAAKSYLETSGFSRSGLDPEAAEVRGLHRAAGCVRREPGRSLSRPPLPGMSKARCEQR